MRCVVALVLLVFAAGAIAQDATASAVYVAPTYWSKAASLASEAMLAALRGYTHAAQPGVAIPSAPHCIMSHDALAVSSVNLDSVAVEPINATALRVTVVGLTPLITTTESFAVNCSFDGALRPLLALPQSGSMSFQVDFGSTLVYEISVTPNAAHNLTFATPVLVSGLSTTPTYKYGTQGFALDVFVANYFQVTLASLITTELTARLTYPSPFPAAFFNTASSAAAVFEMVCGTGVVSNVSGYALWLEPACTPPPATTHAHTEMLATSDILLLVPSSSGAAGTQKLRLPWSSRATFDLPARSLASQSRDAALPSSCTAGIPCPAPLPQPGGVTLAFSNCVICYPNDGVYTELALTVTMTSNN